MLKKFVNWLRWIKNDYRKEVIKPFNEMRAFFNKEEAREPDLPVFDMQPKPEQEKLAVGEILTKSGICRLWKLLMGNREKFEKLLYSIFTVIFVLMIINAWNGWNLIAVAHPIYLTKTVVPGYLNLLLSILALVSVSIWFFFGVLTTTKALKERSSGTILDMLIGVAIGAGVWLGSSCGKELIGENITIINMAVILSGGLVPGDLVITIPNAPISESVNFFGLIKGPAGLLLENALMNAVFSSVLIYSFLKFALKENPRESIITASSIAVTYCLSIGIYIGMANAIILFISTSLVSAAIIALISLTIVPVLRIINKIAGKQILKILLLFWPVIALVATSVIYILIIPMRIIGFLLGLMCEKTKKFFKKVRGRVMSPKRSRTKDRGPFVSFLLTPIDAITLAARKIKDLFSRRS